MSDVKAEKTVREVTKVVEEEAYVLTLPPEHAETLALLFQQVGGSQNGRRGDIEDIARALREAGMHVKGSDDHFEKQIRGQAIYFRDERLPVYHYG
jgi:hypothetical protein